VDQPREKATKKRGEGKKGDEEILSLLEQREKFHDPVTKSKQKK